MATLRAGNLQHKIPRLLPSASLGMWTKCLRHKILFDWKLAAEAESTEVRNHKAETKDAERKVWSQSGVLCRRRHINTCDSETLLKPTSS